MFVEEMTCLDLMQWDDNVLEEDNVLLSQGYCKSTDNTGKYIEQFRGAVELEGLMDQRVETVVDGFTDHFSSRNEFGIKAVKNVLEVLTLAGLL